MVTVQEFQNLVGPGRFFSVVFNCRSDGRRRRLFGRVPRNQRQSDRLSFQQRNNMATVWDVQHHGYRNVPLENLRRLRAGGRTYTWGE